MLLPKPHSDRNQNAMLTTQMDRQYTITALAKAVITHFQHFTRLLNGLSIVRVAAFTLARSSLPAADHCSRS